MDKELKTSASISTFTRWMVVAIISCGAYVVYLTYLARYSFYDQVILVFHSSELRSVKDDLPAVWTVYHLHLLGDPL